jgi:predicted kinase
MILPHLSTPSTVAPVGEAWLVTGIPGAGKSTVSRLLAASVTRGAHIEGDRLQEWIASGAVWPGQEPPEEANRQIALNRRNQCLLARSLADAGFLPVIDYVVVSRSLVADYQRLLDGLEFRLVMLAPGRDVALLRDRHRPEKTVAEVWAFLEDELRRELGGIGLWVDSRDQAPEETLAEIIAREAESRLDGPISLTARQGLDLK